MTTPPQALHSAPATIVAIFDQLSIGDGNIVAIVVYEKSHFFALPWTVGWPSWHSFVTWP